MVFAVIKAVYDRLSHSLRNLTKLFYCIRADLYIRRKVAVSRSYGGKRRTGPNVLMTTDDARVEEHGLNTAHLLCLLSGFQR